MVQVHLLRLHAAAAHQLLRRISEAVAVSVEQEVAMFVLWWSPAGGAVGHAAAWAPAQMQ